ncbi:MAG: hypothetical protein RL722_927, partial [Pseudomonadota bacterium]
MRPCTSRPAAFKPAAVKLAMHPSRLSSLSPRALACALSCTLACALLPAGGLALLPVSAALAAGPAASGPPPAADPAQLERRLQSVATLIDASSAARQIEASGVAAARAHRDNARLIHREAADALKAGDLTATLRLLDQATREMMDGARQARPEQVTGAKSQRDFDARLE